MTEAIVRSKAGDQRRDPAVRQARYQRDAALRDGIGDALRDGIGAMSEARVVSFFDKMVRAGVVRPDLDYRKSFTLRFTNKGVGLNLRPKN